MALSDEATVVYLYSTPYAPGREHGVHPFDPAIGIASPMTWTRCCRTKDAAAPTLAQAQTAGLLPDYQECVACTAKLARGAASGVLDQDVASSAGGMETLAAGVAISAADPARIR
jgi:dTDP-4-dehydrorhamnose 3,5-epimerase